MVIGHVGVELDVAVMIVCAFSREVVFQWATDEMYVWWNKSDVVGVRMGVHVQLAVGSFNVNVTRGGDLTLAGDAA